MLLLIYSAIFSGGDFVEWSPGSITQAWSAQAPASTTWQTAIASKSWQPSSDGSATWTPGSTFTGWN